MTRIALAPSKMVLLMSLVITGAHASPEQPLIKDTPFVSGQAYKKGFFWYDDPAKKSEAEEEEVLPPTGAASLAFKRGNGRFKFKMAKREYASTVNAGNG
ncbi:hypothetical protein JEZ95_00075 (plasmid) [Enterobacter hormaechei]|nr:hypothetical protein [Enterobacter hormaechei]